MTRLKWGETQDRIYEAGVDRGVLYPNVNPGVVWNGLVSMVEASSESQEISNYIDGVKYYNNISAGSFSATLEAFTYPDEFSEYDGVMYDIITQQRRKSFGLCYRTKIGNAIDGLDAGYKIHLVYNALASPTEKNYTSVGDSTEATNFNWEITTTPVSIPGAGPSAHLIIDTTKAHGWTVTALEAVLYGNETTPATLPSPETVIDIFESNAILIVIDHGDGTFSVTGPDAAIQMLNDTTFQITWDSAVMINETSYTISSL